MTDGEHTLVIGAGSGIAQAIIAAQLTRKDADIVAVSRQPLPDLQHRGVRVMDCDYSETDIGRISRQLQSEHWVPDTVVICNGLLHNDHVFPEKKLRDCSAEQWLEVMQVNALIPLLWLQALADIIPSRHHTTIALFSARVGSISDNQLGGWYSYRASKAALNMLVRTAAVEFRRTHPNLAFLLFHPGTTATPLSAPFQRRVPEGKLFTAAFVADQLLTHMRDQSVKGTVRFIDWAGQDIDW